MPVRSLSGTFDSRATIGPATKDRDNPNDRVRHSLRRAVCGLAATVTGPGAVDGGRVKADPAADALSKLNELSQQAVQTREAVTAAQRDADARLAAQTAADDRHRADLAALEAANAQLQPYQAAVDRVAAMDYMSGRTGQLAAVLTAGSPQQLIDQLSLQRTSPRRRPTR